VENRARRAYSSEIDDIYYICLYGGVAEGLWRRQPSTMLRKVVAKKAPRTSWPSAMIYSALARPCGPDAATRIARPSAQLHNSKIRSRDHSGGKCRRSIRQNDRNYVCCDFVWLLASFKLLGKSTDTDYP
jgi:hypothetical protein